MRANNVKVSIIVPIYNVEKYLQRCIDSLRDQTFKNIEIILVNDGSPDNCGEICEENAKKDSRIKVIHKPNGGVSDARNCGIKTAQGEYLLFIDPDDWVEKNIVEKLFNSLEENNADISVCGYSIDYVNNNFSVKKSLLENELFVGNKEISNAIYILDSFGMFNVVWNKMYKREIITEKNISFKMACSTGEDLLFNCEYFKNIKSIIFVNESLLHYMRQDEDTLVTKYRENLNQQISWSNNARKNLYDFYMMNTEQHLKCYAGKYCENIFAIIPNIFRENCELSSKEKRKVIQTLLSNNEVKNWIDIFTPSSFYEKQFKFLYRLNNSLVMYLVYLFMFRLKNSQGKLYRKIRRHILK